MIGLIDRLPPPSQPFSTASTSVSYHSASPTVLRYTSASASGVRQVSSGGGSSTTTAVAPTGILRRVGSSMVGGNAQSVFAVTPASAASGATHVISVSPCSALPPSSPPYHTPHFSLLYSF